MTIIKEDRFEGIPRDFESLKKGFQECKTLDASLKSEDDAKKKAIKSSRNYDEFKCLVDTRHLKPAIRNGKIERNEEPKAAPMVSNVAGVSEGGSLKSELIFDRVSFLKEFGRSGDKEKFLVNFGNKIPEFFVNSMDEGLFFDVMAVVLGKEELRGVLDVMKSAVWWSSMEKFLSKKERELVK